MAFNNIFKNTRRKKFKEMNWSTRQRASCVAHMLMSAYSRVNKASQQEHRIQRTADLVTVREWVYLRARISLFLCVDRYISIAECVHGIAINELTRNAIAEKKAYIKKGTGLYNITPFFMFQVQNIFI